MSEYGSNSLRRMDGVPIVILGAIGESSDPLALSEVVVTSDSNAYHDD